MEREEVEADIEKSVNDDAVLDAPIKEQVDSNAAADLARRLSSQSLIDIVDQSPKAVAIHDIDSWLSIFSDFNVVEDPVGAKPTISGLHDSKSGNRGIAPLQRFFETFIAPNQIKFHVDEDIVFGMDVVRDLTIEIRMSEDVIAHVPMHLLYQLTAENNEVRIRRLAAHWELIPMVMQVMNQGLSGIKVMSLLGWRMLKLQGVGAMLGFCQALMTIGSHGKDQAYKLVRALNGSDERLLKTFFDNENIDIHYPGAEKSFKLSDLAKKNIHHFDITKILSAGYTTSFSFSMKKGDTVIPGVGFIDFNSKSKKIDKVKLCWNQ